MKQRIAFLFATLGYVGKIPGAPGSYASLLTTLALYTLYCTGFRILPELLVSVICLVTVLGVMAADEVCRMCGQEDPPFVVVDEVAGQLLTFLFLPVSGFHCVAGFLIFRAYDIWKPFPIRRLESLRHGVGIVADDLMAGLYANIAVRLVDLVAGR